MIFQNSYNVILLLIKHTYIYYDSNRQKIYEKYRWKLGSLVNFASSHYGFRSISVMGLIMFGDVWIKAFLGLFCLLDHLDLGHFKSS